MRFGDESARRCIIMVTPQVLPRGGGSVAGLRHRQVPDLRERGQVAEGAAGPCRAEHSHHAGGKQVRSEAPALGAD